MTDDYSLSRRALVAAAAAGLAVPAAGAAAPGVTGTVAAAVGGLTGAGVAYKLAQGLLDAAPDDPSLTCLLDLVTLGTIADLGRITGENRASASARMPRSASTFDWP